MTLLLFSPYFQAREANEKRKVCEVSPKISGSELVRVSMMLQEANSIVSQLGKEILFTREDIEFSENGEILSKIGVRLYNTHNKSTTLWELGTFENRLEHLRDLYLGESDFFNDTTDIFDLADDKWTNDPGLYTPGKANSNFSIEQVAHDSPIVHTSTCMLPILPPSVPESLVNILTSSTERYCGYSLRVYGNNTHPKGPNNLDLCDGIQAVNEPNSENLTYNMNLEEEENKHTIPAGSSIPPSDLFKLIGPVPELCIERLDRLIGELKQHKKITSLEQFLNHAEFLLQYSGDFMVGYYSKLQVDNDLRRASLNISVSFEIFETNCVICCSNIISGLKSDELAKELVSLGLCIKQILFSTQSGSNVNVKYMVEQVAQHIDKAVSIISQSFITQLVFYQLNSKRGSRLCHDSKSPGIDVQAFQLLSHKGNISGSICRGALTYVKEVCYQVMQSVSSSYQQSRGIAFEYTKNSFVNSGILNAVCNLLKFMQHFISAVSLASETINKRPETLEPLFRESWPKLVWVLNTLLNIECGVLRLTNNTKEAAENHGELEKVISQANVIAFHTMSATTSLEEIYQCGYDLIPSNVGLEPLSKDVIRAAKVLNSLAKKCYRLSTDSIVIGQFE